MAREKNSYTIVSGPGELDFFVLGLARKHPMTFKFREAPRKIVLIIDGIEARNNSGVEWRFKGYIHESCQLFDPRVPYERVEGLYSFRNSRSGWLKILHTEYDDN